MSGTLEERNSANDTANMNKTELQRFAEEVAASHLGMDQAKLATACHEAEAAPGISPVEIVALIEMIAQVVAAVLEKCPEPDPARVVSAIARPTFWQRVRVKNLMKEYCDASPHRPIWKSAAGALADQLLDSAARSAATRVRAVLAEVQASQNWLI